MKLTPKELKRPDEFQTRGLRTLQWARVHSKRIALAVGLLVLLSAGALGFNAWRLSRAEAASKELSELADDVRAEEESPGSLDPSAATKWTELAERAGKLAEAHSGTRAAAWAKVIRGKSLLRAGRAAEAEPVLQEAVGGVTVPLLKALAIEILGYAQLEAGKTDEALKTFESLSAIESPLKALVPYYRGIVLARQGKPDEASKAFAEAGAAASGSMFWGRKVADDIRLQELGETQAWLDAIRPPEPAK
ncbi:MAG: tetratricopeptide repeat protein [Nitrospirae bacterium]|nr:tetratricopeptide repeat protein [Nitrospirota bacterium]